MNDLGDPVINAHCGSNAQSQKEGADSTQDEKPVSKVKVLSSYSSAL